MKVTNKMALLARQSLFMVDAEVLFGGSFFARKKRATEEKCQTYMTYLGYKNSHYVSISAAR